MQKVTWKHVVAKGEILRTELLDVLPHLVGLHTLGFRRVNGLEYTHAVQRKLLKLVQRDLILPRTRGVTLYSQQRQPITEHTSCTLVYKATTHNRIYRRDASRKSTWSFLLRLPCAHQHTNLGRLVVDADLDALLGGGDGTTVRALLVDASERCHVRALSDGQKNSPSTSRQNREDR